MKNYNAEETLVEKIFDEARLGNKEALHELETRAEKKDAEALDRLAEIYLKGLGNVEQSPQKAVERLERAAALDYPPALYRLGEFYRDGKGGIEADGYKAIEYLTKAENWYAIAEIYLYGKCGVAQDGYKAIEYFSKAESWFDIALIFQEGKADLKQDFQKAIEYYTKINAESSIEELTAIINSAEQLPQTTDEPDYSELARRYREGIGVKQDGQKALEYFIKDFEENDNWQSRDEALQIYLYGCGELKPDWRKAFEFAEVPPDGGFLIYEDVYFKSVCVFDEERGYFRKSGWGTLKALEARVNRLEKLKAPDIIRANELNRIAELYEEGYGGFPPNREKAIATYEKIDSILGGKNIIFKKKLAYLNGTKW